MTQKLSASSQATNAAAQTPAPAEALSATTPAATDGKTAITEAQRKLLEEEKARQKAATAAEAASNDAAAAAEAATDKAVPAPEAAPVSAAPAASGTQTATPAADPLAETIAKAEANAGTAPAASAPSSSGFSPWLIGGGVLAAVGIGVAAGGSDDNNSAGTTTLAQTPGNSQPTTGADAAGNAATANTANSTGNTGTTTPATGGATGTGSTTGTDTGNGTGTGTTTPTPPADAAGPTASVAASSADNRLSADLFDDSAANTQFIQITRIQSAEGSDLDARIYRDYKVTQDGQTVDRYTAYEVVESAEGLTWEEARAAAERLGGKLLVIDNQAEADFVRTQLSSRLGDTPENFADLSRGAWIGLQQTAGQASPDAGWNWINGVPFSAQDWATYGANIGGADNIPTDGSASSATEADKANHAAIIEGWDTRTNGLSSNMIFDHGGKLNRFVVEYEHEEASRPLILDTPRGREGLTEGHVIGREDFDKILWNSVFSSHGRIEYVAVDGWENPQTVAGARTVAITIGEGSGTPAPTAVSTSAGSSIASLLNDDQNLPV